MPDDGPWTKYAKSKQPDFIPVPKAADPDFIPASDADGPWNRYAKSSDTSLASAQPLPIDQFAARVRKKYPGAYDSLSDSDLVSRVVAKYPQYKDQVASYGETQFEKDRSTGEPGVTDSYNPNAEKYGPVVRALDAAGGAVIGAPAALMQSVMHPLDTLSTMGESIGSWFDPKTRPTLGQIKYALPEALGGGIGSVAGGELAGGALGKIGEGVGKVRAGASRLMRDPLTGEPKSPYKVAFDTVLPDPDKIARSQVEAQGMNQRMDARRAVQTERESGRMTRESERQADRATKQVQRERMQDAKDARMRERQYMKEGAAVPVSESPVPGGYRGPKMAAPEAASGPSGFRTGSTMRSPSGSLIIDPNSAEAKAPPVEGSFWSFKEQALRKAVLSGDRDAAVVYKQRFGELPAGAGYLTDVGQGATSGLYRSRR